MNPNCLTLVKEVVSDAVYKRLDDALTRGDQQAWEQTMIDTHADIALIRRQTIIDARVLQDFTTYLQNQSANRVAWEKAGKPAGMNRGSSIDEALTDFVSGSGARQSSGTLSVERYIEGVRGDHTAGLVDLMHKMRTTKMGLSRASDDEFAHNLVRNIFGGSGAKVSKEIQALTDAWLQTSKKLVKRFNQAGGSITELENWSLPVNHNSPNIIKAGEEQWVKDAKEMFDVRRNAEYKDDINDDELLRKIYRTLADEGATVFDPSSVGIVGKTKLGNSHQQWRYLQPKDGQAWLDYTTKYGKHQQPIDAMIEYVDNMSTSIGLMEKLGSNPQRMFDAVIAGASGTTKNNRTGRMAKAALDQIMARNPGADSGWAHTLTGFRNFQTASKLGSAPLTALTDVPFSAITSVYNGMNPFKVMNRHIKLLNPASTSDRQLAGRIGLLMDYSLNRAAAVNRYSDNVGYGWTHRMADFSTRLSGLNHWTNAGKTAFGLEYMANMGKMAGREGRPTGGMAKAFKRYGISDADWDALRQGVTTKDGVDYLDVTLLGDEHRALKAKVIGMVREETSFAIPEPNAKARAVTQAGTRRNTVANEMIKTMTQFKSFSVSLMMTHMGRVLNDTGSMASRVTYGASMFLGASAMGMAVLQAKAISKGRTPREMNAQLVMDGMIQGGSLAVVGDIFFNDPDLFGGLPAYAVGPTAGDFVKFQKFMWEINEEREAKGFAAAWHNEMAPGLVNGAEQATAFATKLWYTRLAFERAVMVHVNETVDPNYYKKQRRLKKWMREERGQETWVK